MTVDETTMVIFPRSIIIVTAADIALLMIILTVTTAVTVNTMNTVMVVGNDRERMSVMLRVFNRWMLASILENNTEYFFGSSRTKCIAYTASHK